MCLIGTSEIPLTAIYYNQIIDQSQLPIRLLGYSHCFRQETGMIDFLLFSQYLSTHY